MANEFEKRMKKDMERRLASRIKASFNPIVIGRVPTKEETVDVDTSRVKDTSHKIYKNKIEEAANAYHTNIDLKKNEEQIIVNMWININGKGHLNDYHCHHYSVLSGAFYLRPGSAPIVFQHPYRYINSFYWETNMISKWNPVNSSVFTILPEANNLIIFPAWIEHKVLMNMEDTERISFSFNTHLKLKGE